MKSLSQRVFSVLFASICLFFSTQAQTDEHGRWIYREGEPAYLNATESPAEKAEIMSRWQKIGEELKADNSKNEIWGKYFVGDLHISLLRISEKNGYVMLHVNTCAMDIYGVEYGDVYFSADKLFMYPRETFNSRNSHSKKMSGMMPQEWVLAKLKDTNYLLHEENVKDFCDSIAGYDENAVAVDFGLRYFGKAAKTDSMEELPILPAAYRHRIKKPIGGKIISVVKRRIQRSLTYEGEPETDFDGKPVYESVVNVTLNIGKLQGVQNNMQFYILNPDASCCGSESVEIQTVNEKTSIGIIRRSLDDESNKLVLKRKDSSDYGALKPGLAVTTSYFSANDFEYAKIDKQEEK